MTTNRVINDPDRVVEDMLQGWIAAHGDTLRIDAGNARVVRLHGAPRRGKVGIVTGGGSGHEPAFLGYVGDRKSTRLNSSHLVISYAVFCLKKKKTHPTPTHSYPLPPMHILLC